MLAVNHLKKSYCFLFILLMNMPAFGQKKSTGDLFSMYAGKKDGYDSTVPYYILFSHNKMPQPAKPVRQLDEHTAIVSITNVAEYNKLKSASRLAAANNDWKLPPGFKLAKAGNDLIFTVAGPDIIALKTALETQVPGIKIVAVNAPSNALVIRTTPKLFINKILPMPAVSFADQQQKPVTEIGIIGYNRGFHGINALDYNLPGANGEGVTVGVKEQTMEAADLDLYKRVSPSTIAAAVKTNHATVISSIIGGAGNSFYDGRGIANACKFFPSSFDNLFPDDAGVLQAANVNIQNHSYGTIVQSFYGAEALSYDAQTWANKNMLHIFSSGNKGREAAPEGRYANIPGYANLTGNFKMAKNVLTVGAIDNLGNIAAESSAGPAYDGRLMPQLVALGPNGTSDAAAMVTGTAAVMRQLYADSNANAVAPASLIKAVLYNTATDLYNKGIDFKTGYGSLNAYEATKAILGRKYDAGTLSQGQVWSKNITLPAGIAELKITLAWTDSNTSLNNNSRALSNDLDMELRDVSSGIIYKPWVLNVAANADSLNKPAIRKRDSLNTAEQISVTLPSAGNYLLSVSGTRISNNAVPFSVAINMDTLNRFQFTSPQHASDVNRKEQPETFIRWKTAVASDNEKGNLYISYNDKASWQLVQPNLVLNTSQYRWLIKDTSSRAVLKMETTFGDFLSKDFVITGTLQPMLDFICTDSLRLSWAKHIYADKYKIFALTDSPYLKHILTTNDSFIVINRSLQPFKVFAVEPVLNNGIAATRSLAMDIDFQGVQCFYKTLYHELLDENKLKLVLELSTGSYVDSVFFEQVTRVGELLTTFPGQGVGTALLYDQLVEHLETGTGYWRARLKMKSGVDVYTEIIAVLSSGDKNILFFPNPVVKGAQLNYMLKQGIAADSRLFLYDITGRLLKQYDPLPPALHLTGLNSGLVVYKLFSRSGKLLGYGKLVLQ